tara:strand:+ start:172 stop:459 length:288 start_codon:yes stop_codon:yes gene_type:complete
MSKQEQFIDTALKVAQESPCLHQHGAVAVLNGKIIAFGYNNYRLISKDKILNEKCSSHAELNVIRNSFYALGGRTVFSGRPSAVKKKRKKLIKVV